MEPPELPEIAFHGLAIAAGIGAHLTYFNHGHHARRTPLYLCTTSTILCLSIWHFLIPGPKAPSFLTPALYLTLSLLLSLSLSFLLGIYTSLLTYRLFLNPLNAFPGPFLARLTDLYQTYAARHLDWHEQSMALKRQYGPFVRVGSSSLLITHPDYVQAMYSSHSKCPKGEFYGVLSTGHGIVSPDLRVHDHRRRIWSQSFGPASLRDYEQRIVKYVDKFVRLADRAALEGDAIDVTRWGSYYAWDLMGDVGLAKDFGLMDTGKDNGALEPIKSVGALLGVRLPMWLLSTLASIPGAQKGLRAFEEYASAQVEARIQERDMKMEMKKRQSQEKTAESTLSILDTLLAHAESPHPSPSDADWKALEADAQVIVMAGSDTTASTLVFALYYLALYPHNLTTLRAELIPLLKDGVLRHVDIQNAKHLNGVINEALRLYPPGSIIPRQSPPEGVKVGEVFIPGGVTLFGSQYVLGRSEDVFERAMEFLPERWYSKPGLVKRKDAFAPFNIGAHSCIGKPLALMELRMLLANLAIRFDMELEDLEDPGRFIDGVRDYHTWFLPELKVRFKPANVIREG